MAHSNRQYADPGPLFPAGATYGSSGAPGSDATGYQREAAPAHAVVGSPPITVLYGSSQVPAYTPAAEVQANDVNVPGQVPMAEPFTQVPNTWQETFPGPGGPDDHVAGPSHPNALPVPRGRS
jgi:hypothetical protein